MYNDGKVRKNSRKGSKVEGEGKTNRWEENYREWKNEGGALIVFSLLIKAKISFNIYMK